MSELNFTEAINEMSHIGFNPYPERFHFRVPNAKQLLFKGIRHYLGDNARWLPAYDEVAEWLSDNQGRGLLCAGNCGLGKTLICSNIIPVILHHYFHKIVNIYDAQAMNTHLEKIKSVYIASIDDVGTESERVYYGERRMAFSEIVDEAEKKSHMLVVTTNLTTTEVIGSDGQTIGQSIEKKYGIRTLDRLKAITKVVLFNGESFRR